MSLTDDLKKFIDSVLGAPPTERDRMWADLSQNTQSPLGLSGIEPSSSEPMRGPPVSPYARDPLEIQSMVQDGAQAFRDVIINPFTLDRDQFPFSLNSSRIEDFAQYDPKVLGTGLNAANTDSANTSSWRTVEVPLIGNFVKIEYLPARRNFFDATNALSNYGTAGDPNTNSKIPNQTVRINSSGLPFDSFPDGRDSTRLILLQFNDNQSTLHVVQHNDTFEVPFTSVFIHVKTTSPRIRVTSGYNAKINPAPDNAIIASQLHMAGGQGLIPQMIWHPVPFCIDPISSQELGDTTGSLALAGSANTTYDLISQSDTTPRNVIGNGGVAVGWITSITGYCFNAGANACQVTFALYVVGANGKVRRLWKHIPGTYTHTLVGDAGGAFTCDFSVPIRFTLKNNYKLSMQIRNPSSSAVGCYFNVMGYTMGALKAATGPTNATNPTTIPYYLPMFTENPYPDDFGGIMDGSNETGTWVNPTKNSDAP